MSDEHSHRPALNVEKIEAEISAAAALLKDLQKQVQDQLVDQAALTGTRVQIERDVRSLKRTLLEGTDSTPPLTSQVAVLTTHVNTLITKQESADTRLVKLALTVAGLGAASGGVITKLIGMF